MSKKAANNIHYGNYAFEAAKITIFCLVVTGFFKFLGVSNNTLLVVFNMAVMSCAATFSIEQKHLAHIALGSITIIISMVIGGIIGFYYPSMAKILTILYAGLAFYLPKLKQQTNIFVTSSVMFLVFSALPFDFIKGMYYGLSGLIVFCIFVIFYFLFEKKNLKKILNKEIAKKDQITRNHISAILAVLSLTLALSINYFFTLHFHFSHLYWIGLTALVIIQGSQQKTVTTSIKRILVNAFGAIVIVVLFNYILPPNFLINFIILVLFLFLIFFLSFSYVGRTLFIELFVLGFTHLLGDYQNAIATDRVLLTLTGGAIVILLTPIVYLFADYLTQQG